MAADQSLYSEDSCRLWFEPSAKTKCLQASVYYMTFLCFRVVIVEYSLNNGITFSEENMKVTSLNFVSAMVRLHPNSWGCEEHWH